MVKSRKIKLHKQHNKNVKKTCNIVCGKTKKILGKFMRNKRYLNKLNKKCNKTCVKKYTKRVRNRKQSGGATAGVLPIIFTNLIDGVSHSAMSTFDVLNGHAIADSPLPFLAHYKPLL